MTGFKILKPQFNAETGTATFRYRLDRRDFTERLAPVAGFDVNKADTLVFSRALDMTAACLGVSYYKLLAPTDLDASALQLTAEAQTLVTDIYENGLGELYARNNLRRFGKINYVFQGCDPAPAYSGTESEQALVPVGGGKDSLLTLTLLDRAGVKYTPFAVNPKGPIISSIERTGVEPIFVNRYLDGEMLRLNTAPGYYNGHVPSTAINSVIAVLIAILYGNTDIILSNERSASEGNIDFDGRKVNHQHSKSLAFEKLFSAALRSITGARIRYYSLLRPFSEVEIARCFAQSEKFDGAFSSCNQNFRQDAAGPATWCGNCPKCHFVFLIFAPFMSPERLTAIVGTNVLHDREKCAAMRTLCGLDGHKPWECVGEILEAAAALWHLSAQEDWKDAPVVKTLAPELEAFYGQQPLAAAWKELLAVSSDHNIPEAIAKRILNIGGTNGR